MLTAKGYTDIHAHILPGLDDGPKSDDQALEMLDLAYKDGIRRVIATPHFGSHRGNCPGDRVLKALETFKEKAAEKFPNMEILAGNEINYKASTVKDLQNGKALTLAGTKYVLVEFAYGADPEEVYRGSRNLVEAGYRPIIAHLERYKNFSDIGRVDSLIDLGACIQINAESFTGGFFNKKSLQCMKLLTAGRVHFIASDCHDAVRRPPVLSAAIRKTGRKDPYQLKKILFDNVACLLADKYIEG